VPSSSTLTVSVTEPVAPMASVPRFQVTVPAAKVPPPVAALNVVPAGITSVSTAL
jgi:hypothetical protein